jgi:hypothetical protein
MSSWIGPRRHKNYHVHQSVWCERIDKSCDRLDRNGNDYDVCLPVPLLP